MIVRNIGYLKYEQVLELFNSKQPFSIYFTKKNTCVLVKQTSLRTPDETYFDKVELYFIQKDRLPYKTTEGKRITGGERVFNSIKDDFNKLDRSKWNNGNQIMCYEEL